MRQRTGREKYAMGLLNPIFRDLAIKKGTRGYMPLMDLICYAYENPDKSFPDIIEYLAKENYYVGVKITRSEEEIAAHIETAAKLAMKSALKAGKTSSEAKLESDEAARKAKRILANEAEFSLIPSMERSIETALEGTPSETLSLYGIEKLSILVEPLDVVEQEKLEEMLMEDLGEKYNEYKEHNERVIVFFVKKLLKYIKS